jgi:hypothetical protein
VKRKGVMEVLKSGDQKVMEKKEGGFSLEPLCNKCCVCQNMMDNCQHSVWLIPKS